MKIFKGITVTKGSRISLFFWQLTVRIHIYHFSKWQVIFYVYWRNIFSSLNSTCGLLSLTKLFMSKKNLFRVQNSSIFSVFGLPSFISIGFQIFMKAYINYFRTSQKKDCGFLTKIKGICIVPQNSCLFSLLCFISTIFLCKVLI